MHTKKGGERGAEKIGEEQQERAAVKGFWHDLFATELFRLVCGPDSWISPPSFTPEEGNCRFFRSALCQRDMVALHPEELPTTRPTSRTLTGGRLADDDREKYLFWALNEDSPRWCSVKCSAISVFFVLGARVPLFDFG